nr:substrate-binding domain-containing protein [Fervidicella metallireducens]
MTGNMKSRPSVDRLSGYKKALEHHGITVKEDNIFFGDYTYESAYEATKKILTAHDRPTAIFVLSNIMMLGCIKALIEEKLKVPDDISVIGFDKIDALNILGMNISFVNGPTEELGETAIDMLMDLLRGKNNGIVKRVTLSPQIVLKGSERYKGKGI